MTQDTVSGREYTSTRVRGFAPWNPRQATLEIVRQVQGVLAEYSEQLPLTNRQIFYRLVGSKGYPKTEQAYARLCEYINRARRAGMIDFSAIRDDGTASTGFSGWSSPGSFWSYVRRLARGYRHNLTDGQPYHIEVWVEAGGMVPQAANVAGDYGIITYSAGGFNGTTDKKETADRLAAQSKPCIVLHLGDYDPSGLSILDSLAQDVVEFHAGMDGDSWTRAALEGAPPPVEFRRVVVTPEQIAEHQLPTAPQKGTDNRGDWMNETVQAEALPPDVLAAELRAAIEAIIDASALEAAHERGDRERDQIIGTLDDLI